LEASLSYIVKCCLKKIDPSLPKNKNTKKEEKYQKPRNKKQDLYNAKASSPVYLSLTVCLQLFPVNLESVWLPPLGQ
jgi:hypothetical protein